MHYSKINQRLLIGKYKGMAIGDIIEKDPNYLRNLILNDNNFTLSESLLRRLNKLQSLGSPILDQLNSFNDNKQNIEDRLETHEYEFQEDIDMKHDYENDVWEERDNGDKFENNI